MLTVAVKMFGLCCFSRASVVGFVDFRAGAAFSLAGVTFYNFENGAEDGFARSAAHQETVQVRQSDEVFTVRFGHAASVDNANSICCLFVDVFAHPYTDILACLLSLVSTCNSTGADGPKWLVNDNDLRPVLHMLTEGFELLVKNLFCQLFVLLLGSLTNAVDDTKVAVLSASHFLGDLFLCLTEEVATL